MRLSAEKEKSCFTHAEAVVAREASLGFILPTGECNGGPVAGRLQGFFWCRILMERGDVGLKYIDRDVR